MKSEKVILRFLSLLAIVHQSLAIEYWRERTYLPEVESKLRWESGRITDETSSGINRHRSSSSSSSSSSRANGDIASSSASTSPVVSSNARRYSTFYHPPNESPLPSPLNVLRSSSSSSSSSSLSGRQPFIPDVESDSPLEDRFTNMPSSASTNKESSSPIVLPHGRDLRLTLPEVSSRPRYLSSNIDRSSNVRPIDEEDDTSYYNRGYSNSRTQQRPPQRMRTPYSTSDHLVDDDSRSPHPALPGHEADQSDRSYLGNHPLLSASSSTTRDHSEVTSVPPAAPATADRPVAYSSNARRYPPHLLTHDEHSAPSSSLSAPQSPSSPRVIQYNNYAQPDGRQNRGTTSSNQGEFDFNLTQEEARRQEEERIRDHLRRQEEKRRENESRRQQEEAIRLADRKNRQKDEAERAAAEREEGERDSYERKREEERLRRQKEAEKRSQKPNNFRVAPVNDGGEEAIASAGEDSFSPERGNSPAPSRETAAVTPGHRTMTSSNRNRFSVNEENSGRLATMSTLTTVATTVRPIETIRRSTSTPRTTTESTTVSSSYRPRPAGRPGGSRRFIGRKRVSESAGQRTTLTTTTTTTTPAPDDYEEDYEDDYEDDRTTTTTTQRPKRRRNGRRRNRYRDRDDEPTSSTTPSTTTIRTTTTTLSPGYRERSDGRIIDFKADPNFPHELKGVDLTDYPFYVKVPEDVNFNCEGRHDGYYASVQHHCQIYHHCAIGNRYDFLCPNYTLFDQTTFTCRFINTVNCGQSTKYYNRNNDLYVESTTEGTSTGDSNKNNNGNSNKKESNNKKFGSNSPNNKNSSNNSNLNNDDNNSNNNSGGSGGSSSSNGHRSAR